MPPYPDLRVVALPQKDLRPNGNGSGSIPIEEKGAPGGVATLDENSRVEPSQMALDSMQAIIDLQSSIGDPGDLTLIFDNQLI